MKGVCPTAVSCDAAVSFNAMAVPRVLSGSTEPSPALEKGRGRRQRRPHRLWFRSSTSSVQFSPSAIRTVLFPSSGLPLPSLEATLVLGDEPTSSRGSAFPS